MTAFCRTAPWLALALTLAASPALAASGPPPGFVLTDNADLAFTSPDGATLVSAAAEEVDYAALIHPTVPGYGPWREGNPTP